MFPYLHILCRFLHIYFVLWIALLSEPMFLEIQCQYVVRVTDGTQFTSNLLPYKNVVHRLPRIILLFGVVIYMTNNWNKLIYCFSFPSPISGEKTEIGKNS